MGDACEAPELELDGDAPSRGRSVGPAATGVVPGELVRFAATGGASGGVGPCPLALGGLCLDLGPGVVVLGPTVADASGTALLASVVPAGSRRAGWAPPRRWRSGPGGADSVPSPFVVVDGARLDWDGDGLVDAIDARLGSAPIRGA